MNATRLSAAAGAAALTVILSACTLAPRDEQSAAPVPAEVENSAAA